MRTISQPCLRASLSDRTTVVVALLVPAVLFVATVRLARASLFKTQAILCDGIDDELGPPALCALPEETTKDFSSTKARIQAAGKIGGEPICLSGAARVETRPLTSRANSPVRLKRPTSQLPGSADDPDAPH